MELVPSAVRPNPIEQRCRIAEVRTSQKVWSPEARNPFLVLWGLEIPKRTRPEGPLRSRPEGQKTIDLVDPSSASVSAQTEQKCLLELAEGEFVFCPRALPGAQSLIFSYFSFSARFSFVFPLSSGRFYDMILYIIMYRSGARRRLPTGTPKGSS